MGQEEFMRPCSVCEKMTLHKRYKPSGVINTLLFIVSGGLSLLLPSLRKKGKPVCTECGAKGQKIFED